MPEKKNVSIIAARLSIVAAISYQLLLVALIFIRPDLDPSWHTISEWAIGPHGWIMSMAFLISALSYGSLWLAIKSQLDGLSGKVGGFLLFTCSVGTVGVGLFTTDPYPPEKTLSFHGVLHIISGSIAMLLLPVAALLINSNLARRNHAFAAFRRPLLWTAGLPLLALIGFIVHLTIFVLPLGDYYGPGLQIGWPPRILFLSYAVWLVVLASMRIKHGNDAAPKRA